MSRPRKSLIPAYIMRGRALIEEAFWKQAIEDAKALPIEERLFFLNEIMRLYLLGEVDDAKELARVLAAYAEELRARARFYARKPARSNWTNKLPT